METSLERLLVLAESQPHRLAAVNLRDDRMWSYGEFDYHFRQYAALLLLKGVLYGDRVACISRNSVELVLLHLACTAVGAIFVPFNWRLTTLETHRCLQYVEPVLIIGDASFIALDVTVKAIAWPQWRNEASQVVAINIPKIDPGNPSLLLFTSGTTGAPKGVMLSEYNITATIMNFCSFAEVNRDSVFLCDMPMFHVIGLVINARTPLFNGAGFLVSDEFHPAQTLARLSDPALSVTHYFCIPQMAEKLRKDPSFDPGKLHGLTALFTGGSPYRRELIQQWLDDGILVANGYGMSESGTVFCMPLDPVLMQIHAGSVGLAAPGVEVRIVDHEGVDCAPGKSGELFVKGPGVLAYYWRLPQDTRQAFNSAGWFKTGDQFYVDDDGFHWLVGRLSDRYISLGEKVFPSEIEAVLQRSPEIAECSVLGVPDKDWGEVGHIFLVPVAGGVINRVELLASLREQIAGYKIPKYITVVASLPRNGLGKVIKSELYQMAQNGSAQSILL